jgi:hypothetical protein
MAFTSAQNIKLVTILGWPAKVLDNTNTSYNSTIYARITGIDSDMENLVTEYMDRLEDLEGKLSIGLARTGVKRIDDIEFFGNDGSGSSELNVLRAEKKRLLKELASILDIALGLGASNSNMVNVCI